ncbi:MAG: glycosyl hydrolase [Myxococcaceae bacterium]|nr:glycosyl hydrolase [Myxococcaceae bacterium]
MRLAVATAVALFAVCSSKAAEPKPGASRTSAAPQAAEVAYQQGLKKGWMDFGWSPRKKNPSGPELHDLSGYGGWILTREQPMTAQQAGGLTFTYKAPPEYGEFFEVRLDKPGTSGRDWEKVRIGAAHKRALQGGAFEVFVPMADLNPKRLAFDRIVLFAFKEVPKDWVAIDDVALTVPGAGASDPAPVVQPGPDGKAAATKQRISIDCKKKGHTISPLIYGIAFYPMWEYRDQHHWAMKPAGRRWGGNHSTRYNYLLGEAWNAGMDWYFRNLDYTGRPGWSWETFLEANAKAGVHSTITVPMMGWVAKDTTSFSYPIKDFPNQQDFEQSSGAGNGRDKNGKWLNAGSPTKTSVPANPEFVATWVKLIKDKAAKLNTPVSYILDNEPALWDSTHHDIHPEPVGYDELWERTKNYATAIKKVDPQAKIAGPAEWGWSNYLYSQKDLKMGGPSLRPDRRMHGDLPIIAWYLKKIAEHEKQTKVRLVDTLDLHFYPQAEGVGIAETGDTSPEASLRRIRSTRGLWDPTYHDESWIDDEVMLIPRMKKWVADYAPGLGTSIGEWNFGAEGHISGGLATAEALGRFGQQDLTSAWYWSYPPDNTPSYWAFRAYRDYDGAGSRFQDVYLPTKAFNGASAFASVSPDGAKLTAVLLNLDPKAAYETEVALDGCGEATARRVFSYVEGARALEPKKGEPKAPVALEPFSINVVEWSLKK